MRRGGKLAWLVGILVTLGVLICLVLANGRVQTKLVRHVLADQPGLVATVGSVKLSWNQLRLTDLVVNNGPLSLRLPALEAELPVWRLFTAGKRVDRLVARGWEVRWDGSVGELATSAYPRIDGAGWAAVLANLETGGAGESAALWEQLTQLLNQPLPITMGEVELQGRAFWRQAGPGADGFAEVRVSGRGPSRGTTQSLLVDIDATGTRADARGIQSLRITNRLETLLATDQSLDRLNLNTELIASLEEQVPARVYGLELDLEQVNGAPRLALALREEDLPLVSARLGSSESTANLEGEWSLSLNATNISHLMLGRELPAFSVDGHGELSANNTLADAALNGVVTFVVTDLGTYVDALSGVGDLSGELNFAVQQSGPNTRFTRFDLALAGAAPVLEARLLQGVEIGADAFELRVANPEEPLCEIELAGLPPAWIQPWLAPWVLDARPVQGKLIGLVSPQGLRIVTNQPIRMERVALAEAGRTWVDDGLLEVDLGAEITPLGWQVELGRVEIARNGSPVVTLQARGGQLQEDEETIKAVGRVEVDLVGLSQWPGFADRVKLNSGRLTAEFGLGLEERLSIATALTVDELTGLNGVALPSVEMDGRFDLLSDGGVEVHLPARIERAGQRSELTFNLRAAATDEDMKFEGSVSSPGLYVQDLMDFASLIPADPEVIGGAPAPSDTLSPVQVAAPIPIWGTSQGSLQLSVAQVFLPDAPAIERVRAELIADSTGLQISMLEARVGSEGRLDAKGRLAFNGTESEHYQGVAEVKISDVAVEPWLRWFDPEELPVLTGRVNVDATWNGVASDPSELADAGVFQAQITSPGGVIRALGVDVEDYIQTGQTVAALGALFGAVTGNQQLQQQAQKVQSATAAAELLAAITFDQLSLNLERVPGGDIVLSDLSLIAPTLRLLGEGRITYRVGQPFWLQPLELNLSLSAREELGAALQQLGVLRSQADSLGYLLLISGFSLDGNLANIGTQELEQLLMRALR